MRTMVAPGVWRDEGPGVASSAMQGYAIAIGDMIPAIPPAGAGPVARVMVRSYCDAPMPRVSQRCARRFGHSGFHKSRTAMDHNANHRRKQP
jgi:hypothetical protein